MAIEDDEPEVKKDEAVAPAKGSRLYLALVILQSLLIVGLVVSYFLFLAPKDGGAKSGVDEASVDGGEGESTEIEEEGLEGERPLGAIVPLDQYMVNLRDAGYLKVRIQLELTEREVPLRFYAREVVMRDAVLTLLSTKTKDTLLTVDGKDSLRDELRVLLNEVLKKEMVEKIYFTEFAVR